VHEGIRSSNFVLIAVDHPSYIPFPPSIHLFVCPKRHQKEKRRRVNNMRRRKIEKRRETLREKRAKVTCHFWEGMFYLPKPHHHSPLSIDFATLHNRPAFIIFPSPDVPSNTHTTLRTIEKLTKHKQYGHSITVVCCPYLHDSKRK
jgi:hypothetical protein